MDVKAHCKFQSITQIEGTTVNNKYSLIILVLILSHTDRQRHVIRLHYITKILAPSCVTNLSSP